MHGRVPAASLALYPPDAINTPGMTKCLQTLTHVPWEAKPQLKTTDLDHSKPLRVPEHLARDFQFDWPGFLRRG